MPEIPDFEWIAASMLEMGAYDEQWMQPAEWRERAKVQDYAYRLKELYEQGVAAGKAKCVHCTKND